MKKLICILLTVSLLMSVLMSVMVFSASADIVPTGYVYVDNSEAPSEAPTEVELEPTSYVPTPEPTEEALLDPTEPYTPAEATEAKPIFELKYEEIGDGTLQICGFENNTGTVDLVIPSEHNGKAVTRIAKSVFANNSDIVSVTLPETITYIDTTAFGYCSNLETINYNCINAEYDDWSNYTGHYVFNGCNAVKEINIGNNVENIPDYAFARIDIESISCFIIPENVTTIGQNIFSNNVIINTLEYNAIECEVGFIEYRENGESISKHYYKAFPKINTVIVGKNVKEIPSDVYREPFAETNLSTVIFKDGIKNVSGFRGCDQITEIIIPDGVVEISEAAFLNCSNLETVRIPESVITIGKYAFYNTAWLDSQPSGVVYINNVLYYYKDTSNDEDVVVRDGTTDIVDGAFADATHIKSIIIPGSVRRIYENAFWNKEIKSVTLGEGITEIGTGAFYGCQSLETIHLPNSLTTIGNNVFGNCTSLKTAIICDGVKSIGYGAFSGCSSLEKVNIPNGLKELPSQYYRNSWEESGYYYTGIFENCTSLQSISIPDSVKSIDAFTFKNCTSLKKVTIGKGVAEIGCGAFVGCTSLETVNIPNGVKELPSQYKGHTWDHVSYNKYTGIFENCTNLKTITIPDSITFIGAFTFRNCTSLKRASIGKGVDDIGCGAFIGCTSLETVNIPEGITELPSRYKIYNWDNDLYAGIFENCTSLESIILPDSVKKIDNNTFLSCTNLNKVQIDGSVAEIGDNAFYKTAMTSITIKNPNAVLGYKAFGVKNTVYGDAPNEDFIVYGYKGSTAEQYAKEYQLQFNELSIVKHLGDVDGDSNIEVRDATWIQRHIAEVEMPFVINKTTADVDGDGIITVMDATAIQYYLANMKTSYKIGEKIE